MKFAVPSAVFKATLPVKPSETITLTSPSINNDPLGNIEPEIVKEPNKFIELDILKTSDNYLIAAHDWKGLKNECKNLSFTSDNAITLEEFENCNLEFRKLSHKDISRFFDQHGEFKKNELYIHCLCVKSRSENIDQDQ